MDYKLKIFKEVALTKSFTKAAQNLHLSQPAVSKTIRNLEEKYHQAFFKREQNQIRLTDSGVTFLAYSEQILSLYKALREAVYTGDELLPDEFKIGASTTIAYYIIPELVGRLKQNYPQLKINLISGNTREIQRRILHNELDFGIVEGKNHNSRLHYKRFLKDELVLVTNAHNKISFKEPLSIQQLKNLPFVEREHGSGTREVIENALAKHKIKELSIDSLLGNTESIKTYLRYTNHYAFLSVHAVKQELLENRLRIIDIADFSIDRWFYSITRQGFQSKTTDKMSRLFLQAYNQK